MRARVHQYKGTTHSVLASLTRMRILHSGSSVRSHNTAKNPTVQVGSGTYGRVLLCKYKPSGEPCVLKYVNKEQSFINTETAAARHGREGRPHKTHRGALLRQTLIHARTHTYTHSHKRRQNLYSPDTRWVRARTGAFSCANTSPRGSRACSSASTRSSLSSRNSSST